MRPWGIFLVIVLFTAGVILLSLAWPGVSDVTVINPQVKSAAGEIRKPAVAGSFYPATKGELDKQLADDLNHAVKKNGDKTRILILPHAGLDFSGPTAAAGYKLIAGEDYNKVIILGPSHYHQFDHAAVYTGGSWETPLGITDINTDLAQKIVSPGQKIISDPAVHDREHDLEIQLVWLQKVLSDFTIVPILVSQPTEELISALAYRIAQNMDDRTLLIISTDLSHYPDYATAEEVDKLTVEGILSGQKSVFEKTVTDLNLHKYPNTETFTCGFQAIRAGLKVAELLELKNPQLLKYENSGDVTGDKSRVVGYAAIAFGAAKLTFATPQLSPEAQKEALDIARQALNDYAAGNQSTAQIQIKNQILADPLGAFITLRKNGQLRGCIGEFEPTTPLYKVIQQKTVDAASRDPRFEPVTAGELPNVTLEISVMSPRQKINDRHQIRPGTDGVVIIQGNHLGTFLPQVVTETGWGPEEFLGQLCSQKAGLPPDCYLDPATQLYTYQAQVFE
jgi:AmmeMemoRadiSam system protein B/AmmeMemoRadiSam system protein A